MKRVAKPWRFESHSVQLHKFPDGPIESERTAIVPLNVAIESESNPFIPLNVAIESESNPFIPLNVVIESGQDRLLSFWTSTATRQTAVRTFSTVLERELAKIAKEQAKSTTVRAAMGRVPTS